MQTKNLILLESLMKLRIQEAKDNLKPGETLDQEALKEGILDGIKNMFKSGSTIGKGAGAVKDGASSAIQAARDSATAAATKVRDGVGAAVDKTKQVAGDIKTDFQAGNAAGNIKGTVKAMQRLEQKFAAAKQDIRQRFSDVNRERAEFLKTYKAAKQKLVDKNKQQFEQLAKVLKIDVASDPQGWEKLWKQVALRQLPVPPDA